MLRNKGTSSLLLMSVALFSVLLFAPVSAMAENVIFVKAAEQQHLERLSTRITSLSKVSIGLDDEGNAMISYGKLSVSFLNDSGGSSRDNRTQSLRLPSLQDIASIGGLNVKLDIAF